METLGECICTRLEDGRVRVDRADPYIRISLDLLEFIEVDNIVTIGDINPVTYKIVERNDLDVVAERIG